VHSLQAAFYLNHIGDDKLTIHRKKFVFEAYGAPVIEISQHKQQRIGAAHLLEAFCAGVIIFYITLNYRNSIGQRDSGINGFLWLEYLYQLIDARIGNINNCYVIAARSAFNDNAAQRLEERGFAASRAADDR